MRRTVGWPLAAVALPLLLPAAAASKPPSLTVKAIEVEPSAPAAGTLGELRVKILNNGEGCDGPRVRREDRRHRPAGLKNHTWASPLPAGAVTAMGLYSFWLPDARPRTLEVTLPAAGWMRVTKDGDTSGTTLLGQRGPPSGCLIGK